MKKIKLKLLLIPATIIVWSFIMYSVYHFIFDSTENTMIKSHKIPHINKQEVQVDTFTLILNYPDPFLSIKSTKSSRSNTNKISRRKNLVKKKIQPNWPKVAYVGVLQNSNTGDYSVNLSIEGKNVLMSVGTVRYGIQLKQVCFDSVQLVFKNQTKHIKIQSYYD